MGKIWELDFYSRPILDENQKKRWEVLICESPQTIQQAPESLFRYSQFCSSQTVNSMWLRESLEKAIAQASEPPKKIRFFRRQMNNMILKACQDMGIPAAPSRHTYALIPWLEERMIKFYPHQEGYDEKAAKPSSVKYPPLNPIRLPEALRGDRSDQWAFVTLEASAFQEMDEWEMDFSEAFSLSSLGISPETRIPGLIILSPRAVPLAGWMSGLELGFLQLEDRNRPRILLETGVSDSWILADLTNEQTLAEARGFERAKEKAKQVHFLAIQSNPESESFAGFWLLRELAR